MAARKKKKKKYRMFWFFAKMQLVLHLIVRSEKSREDRY